MSRLTPRRKPIHALEQLGRLRVSDTLAVGLLGDNDSQYQPLIEIDNENRSQAAGTTKPQPEKTGARGLSLGFAWGVGSAFGAFIGAGFAW
jgi:hypothetical protein